MRLVLGLAFASAALLLISTAAAAGDWPKGYVVHENSESPDHQFGLVIPGSEEVSEGSDAANYLASLKTHEFLGKLADADYFERQNHRHLNVIWSVDSKTCVVDYKGRFGFDTISVLQLKAPVSSKPILVGTSRKRWPPSSVRRAPEVRGSVLPQTTNSWSERSIIRVIQN